MRLKANLLKSFGLGVVGALSIAAISTNTVRAQTYGTTGTTIDVPYVAPGTLTLDGTADEAAWADAKVINPTDQWDNSWGLAPEPDITTEARLLYTGDTLFVYMEMGDTEFYNEPNGPDHFLVGIDATHAGDKGAGSQTGYDGWPDNFPNLGPVAYKVWAGNDTIPAVSVNFSDGTTPTDSGWVAGTVWQDEETLTMYAELAFPLEEVQPGAMIGFNIGGAAAKAEGAEEREEGAYAYYSWVAGTQPCHPELPEDQRDGTCNAPGGNIMSDAASFATLTMGATGTAVDEPGQELPKTFALQQNYPNPFRGSTTISYGVEHAGNVSVSVYNMLGQKVATLVNERQPAGTYEVRWDAGNSSSGLYLYRMEVDGAPVATMKMLLTK